MCVGERDRVMCAREKGRCVYEEGVIRGTCV